mmetsp:Transcript_38814/g.93163  ORF Transcript_38814/g.93163 Transcript_38814/m.93163 type:complete len:278 (-) Transcript_38814:253-1086(-)
MLRVRAPRRVLWPIPRLVSCWSDRSPSAKPSSTRRTPSTRSSVLLGARPARSRRNSRRWRTRSRRAVPSCRLTVPTLVRSLPLRRSQRRCSGSLVLMPASTSAPRSTRPLSRCLHTSMTRSGRQPKMPERSPVWRCCASSTSPLRHRSPMASRRRTTRRSWCLILVVAPSMSPFLRSVMVFARSCPQTATPTLAVTTSTRRLWTGWPMSSRRRRALSSSRTGRPCSVSPRPLRRRRWSSQACRRPRFPCHSSQPTPRAPNTLRSPCPGPSLSSSWRT